MPVFRSTDRSPAWCALEGFEVVRLGPGEQAVFQRRGAKEKLFVGEGACTVVLDGAAQPATEGDVLDGTAEVATVEAGEAPLVLVRAWGRWGDACGACGVFTLDNSPAPRNTGDPANYPRRTDFDRHYHDCDEYWILFAGRGLAVSEGVFYEVAAGDCVATGRGHHHDFPIVHETVRGVYLETTLEGERRLGHLWEHTHGPAQPCMERV